MSEQQQAHEELPGDKIIEPRKYPLSRTLGFGASTLAVGGIVDLAAHLGPTGLVVGALVAYVVAKHGPEVVESVTDMLPKSPAKQAALPPPAKRNILDRALGRFAEERQQEEIPAYPEEEEEEEDILASPTERALPSFSHILMTFTPSLNDIYLGVLSDGTIVYSSAKGLCHVALAGATGGGKSTIIRLLMSQLCKAGASVLLLNPHYTHYDLEADEDWTPFEPHLVHDPMECRKYEVIEFYLKQVATELLPRRLEKYAHSRPLGKPYFIIIDELPAIVKRIPAASGYLEDILREGRKVGIFLITAATDFLVKTIAPQGGGAIRDCFRTAMYVGGDPTTARILLDMKASNVPEDELGKGVIMLRSSQVKQAAVAHVPYVDNQALYQLLGPSTYVPTSSRGEDDSLERLVPRAVREERSAVEPSMRSIPMREQVASYSRPYAHPTKRLSPELERAYRAYRPGMSYRQLAEALGDVNKDTAGKYIQQLRERRLIV